MDRSFSNKVYRTLTIEGQENYGRRERANKEESEQIIKLLHEPPLLHNINRTSWSLETLSKAYKKSMVNQFLKAPYLNYSRQGFRLRKQNSFD